MTDKSIAKWAGVTPRTLQNWKKPKVLEDGVKYFAPEGKHNIYRSLKLGYYLLNYKTENEESEHYNRLEIVSSIVYSLLGLVEIIESNKYDKEVKESAMKQLKKEVLQLQDEFSNIKNIGL